MKANLIRLRNVSRTRRPALFFDRSNPVPRWLLAILAASLSAGVLMAAVVPGWIATRSANVLEPAEIARVTTASRADTLPLYELPPIFVEADRRTELAKIERERRFDPIEHARSKLPLKPPA
jgi:anti-sigma factor RsiW